MTDLEKALEWAEGEMCQKTYSATLAAAYRAERERADKAERGLKAVDNLIQNSQGVYGLHLNGDVSPWAELLTGGRFEDWLKDYDDTATPPSPRLEGGSND